LARPKEPAPEPSQEPARLLVELPGEPLPDRLPIDWRPMAWLPRLKIFRSPLEHIRPIGQVAVFSGTQRGLFVHRCLEELIALRPLAGSDQQSWLEDAVQVAAAAFPLAVPEALRAEVLDMLAWATALPGAELWFRQGRAEQSVLDEEGLVHRADLLVQDQDRLLVVEYKTGSPAGVYRSQVERYLRLLSRQAEKKADISGCLIYLDSRNVEEIRLPCQ
jgi:hypothetical protein